ncbi:hypothetical protein [Anaerocolumna sp. MB42-C2]|uniref:hypothetical protein n=1 Tax=Anaerocolumna sp. MB42-C2 TaxID=3070997 RepID=UPI0027DFB39C|nr:hypothetical protein [Anaerocolumna sp. MB42-C2]WMJ87457.1 hypothetical protein RBU59_26035 [Anaerocolumna sp. MB42-C2]
MKRKLMILITLLIVAILGACKNDAGKAVYGETTDNAVIKTEAGKTENSAKTKEISTEADDLKKNQTNASDESVGDSTGKTTKDSIEVTKHSTETIDTNKNYQGDNSFDINNPVLLPTPSFSYYKADKVTDNKNQPIQLVEKSKKANQITDDENWFINNKLSMNTLQIPIPSQNISDNLPDEIDGMWEDLPMTSAFHDDHYIYCIYGSDYSEGYILNIYDATSVRPVYSLDFSNYRYSPDYIEEDYDYIQQKINWASIKDNILYISHSHNTYAKSSKNMNGYITAIDLSDMSILWRTDALVSNSSNFQIIGNVIICGYGFTDEPDYLFQIDISSGKILDKKPLKSAASYIIQKDNVLFVRTYNTDYEFDIVK